MGKHFLLVQDWMGLGIYYTGRSTQGSTTLGGRHRVQLSRSVGTVTDIKIDPQRPLIDALGLRLIMSMDPGDLADHFPDDDVCMWDNELPEAIDSGWADPINPWPPGYVPSDAYAGAYTGAYTEDIVWSLGAMSLQPRD